MKRKRLLAALACGAVLVAGVVMASYFCRPPALYRTTVLPSLGGTQMAAHAINEHGQVVGIAQTKDGQWHLFLWDREHGTRDLGVTGAARFDINNAGQIAGAVVDPNGNREAHLWEPGKEWLPLGTLGGESSYAWALNNRGQVVGTSETSDGHLHAFLWDRAHGMRDLGTLGGTESQGRAINDAGVVFGLAHSATEEYRPFLWDPNSGMTAIGPLPPGTSLNGLSNGSWTVGEAYDQPLGRRMVAWNRDAGIRDLFPLARPVYDLPLLNNMGQIVYCEQPADRSSWMRRRLLAPSPKCHLWDPNRGDIPLDSYIRAGAKEVFLPTDINNQGGIVGVVESWPQESRARTILLEPIPERWGK